MIRKLVMAFLLATLSTAASTRVPVYVLEPGVYDKIVIDDGEVWLGVYPGGDHAGIRECKLQVRHFTSEQYEGEGSKVDATRVEVYPAAPLFLVKGSKNVKAGNVTTLYTKGEDYPSKFRSSWLGKSTYSRRSMRRCRMASASGNSS